MKFYRSVSLALIATQFGMGTLMAAPINNAAQAAAPSAEFTLVESVLALQGQNLSDKDLEIRANAAVTKYISTSQASGSQQRLEQALVSLGVYTQAQAVSFANDAQAASARAVAAKAAPTQAQALLSSEMAQLATIHPAGAQFSACTATNVGEGAAGVGLATALVGLIVRFYDPTCHTAEYNSTTCGGGGCYDTTTTGPTYCSAPGYYPDAQAGNDIMIAGGVIMAVGGLVYLLEHNHC